MYEKVMLAEAGAGQRRRGRKDGALFAAVACAVVLALLLIVPLAYSMGMMYRYHSFTQDLAASLVYGERNDTLLLRRSGTEQMLTSAQAERLYTLILDKGMGHPRSAVPETEGLTISFGEGCELWIWPVEITEKGRDNDTGVRLRYTRQEGPAFSYDTDDIQYADLLRILG